MAALPYMQLYVADYLADTYHLTTTEHGAYLLMLFNYWQTEKPLQCKRIPSVVRMDNESFANIEETLKEFFDVDENGYWTHKRIENDLAKVREKSQKARQSSKARWEENAVNKTSKSKRNANALSNAKRTESHKDKDKDKDNIYIYVISHLNNAANKSYRPNTDKTKSLIDARLNDGFTKEDFVKVIDIKAKEWIGTDYEKFLRPETLFSNKFEGYLNQAPKTEAPKHGGRMIGGYRID